MSSNQRENVFKPSHYMHVCMATTDREEIAIAEVDSRGRLQLPLPLRKALKIETGSLVRLKVSLANPEEE
jgi:hypothetical protein